MKTVPASPVQLVEPDVKQRRVRALVTIVLLGTVTSILYHYIFGFYFNLGYPWSTFLFIPGDHFRDWDNLYLYAQAFLQGVPGPFAYFPFAILAAATATLAPMQVGFVLIVVLFLAVLVAMLGGWVVDVSEHQASKVQYAFILVALSYPVVFVLDRANVEMVVFVLLAGFFYSLYVRKVSWLAALFLGATIALKLYPATLLVLLLAERRFRPFVISILFAAALTLIGVVALAVAGHYTLAEVWQMNATGKEAYQSLMVGNPDGVQHGHSLWGLLRLPSLLGGTQVGSGQTTLYIVAAGLIFLVLAAYSVFIETERWKRVLFAVVPALLLPFVSADYTLIWLYFPLVFFLVSPRVSRWDLGYVALFGLLLIPVDYWYLTEAYSGVSTSVVIYPLALIGLPVVAILDRRRSAGTEVRAAPEGGSARDDYLGDGGKRVGA